MKREKVFASLKKIASGAMIVVAGALHGVNIFAATPATMTVYKKGSSPLAFNLSSVKNVTFSSTAAGKIRPAVRVVHSIRMFSSAVGFKFALAGQPGTPALFKIFDLKGRELFSKEFLFGNNGVERMAVPGIAGGLYLAQLKNGASAVLQRVTIGE